MPKLKIEIDLGNAAFDDEPMLEAARILRDVADRLEASGAMDRIKLYDINGNNVGTCEHQS